jgi:hypothetical protein
VLNLYQQPDAPKVVTVSTGGGTQLCGWLVGTPGASSTVLEMNVPYLQSSLTKFLGYPPSRVSVLVVAVVVVVLVVFV